MTPTKVTIENCFLVNTYKLYSPSSFFFFFLRPVSLPNFTERETVSCSHLGILSIFIFPPVPFCQMSYFECRVGARS